MRIKMGKKKAIQATRATKKHKWSSLKSLSNRVDFVAWSGLNALDLSLEWLSLLLQWMWCSEYLDPLKEVVGGIYSLQPLPSRWLSLLTMDTPDSPVVHRTANVNYLVRATSAGPLGFGASWPLEPLSCSYTGQSSATPDMSGALWLLLRTVHKCSLL
jgi:hypothetical protein